MKKIIFFVICFFFMINTSFALSMTCPNVASPGEVIKIHLEEAEYNGIKAKYQFDSSFVYRDLSLNSMWKSYYDGVDGFSIGNVSNQDKLLMDIEVKIGMDALINNDYTLKLVDLEGNDANYRSVDLDDLACNIKVLSDINTLDSLVVKNVTLTPKFDKNITVYEGATSNDKIVIDAVLDDSDATIDGDIGEKKLNLGVNTFSIKVTSARGNVREYKVYITRTVPKKNSDATLKDLTLSVGKINFAKNTFLYLVDVSNEISSIDVEANPNNSKARVEIVKPDELIVGENTISVIVTAEDGTKATYVIIVNRKERLSDNATIKRLNIANYYLDFSSDAYEYDLEISNEDNY